MTQATLFNFEQWLPVPTYEKNYRASDWGQVWSNPRATTRGGILSQVIHNGYLFVTLTQDGKQKTFPVHRLVLLTFVGPPPPGKKLVRHLDGDPANNRWAPGDTAEEIMAAGGNLLYGTHRENAEDMLRHGRCVNASKTHCPEGHEYTKDNTYYLPSGSRVCRICMRAKARVNSRAYTERQRAARPSLERACEFCGKSFTPKRRDAHFCSRVCIRRAAAEKAKRVPETRICTYAPCGKPFVTTWPWQIYCCRTCSRRDNGY